jgi:VanZ family protein
MPLFIEDSARSYLWPFFLLGIVFALSSTSNLATPDLSFVVSPDKIAHFLVYGLIATSVLRTPYFLSLGTRGWVYAALLISAYGGLDEWRQSMTPGRAVELADWLADCAGAIVATTLYHKWQLYRNLLEYRFNKRKPQES